MSDFYDDLETRDPELREAELFSNFSEFLINTASRIPGWAKHFDGIDLNEINSREALSALPVLRKPELMEAQSAHPPFGGFVDENLLDGTRIFMSPGPVWEPQAPGPDPWLAARMFHAAGFRKGDLVQAAIGFTITPGGAILDEGLRHLGCRVFPAGVGNSEMQVEAASVLKPVAYAGTPDFLKIILDRADEMGKDLSCINKALVSGGALFPSLRAEYANRGVRVMQSYATADIGAIAHETMHEGEICPGMICNEDIILEIVRPGTNDPVEPGEVGEIVVTSFNKAYPLIRFGTGDMSAVIPEVSPCGRTNIRIKGWMGRADQRTKVKGMFVDPKQIDAIVKAVPGIEKARLVVTRENDLDAMKLLVVGHDLNPIEISDSLSSVAKLKGSVEVVDSLPNDGKVIDDQRDYES